jgi:CheY-like chemotaxis protein
VSAAFASRHAPALEGISVLVVDDESEARELLKVLLQNEGARVITAGSAIEALDAVARTPCDLMLIDIAMPEADGYSLLRRIRGREMGQAPAIALTAYAREEDRARALAAGFRLHLAKPVEPDALLEAVARTAGRQRA